MEQNVIEINGGIMKNVDASVKIIIYICEKDYVWNHSTESIMDDSAIVCDEVIR